MVKRILIDGSHPEELRVAVCENNQIKEVDYQSSFKKSIKGNVYLAKVERVEAALQVAFVNYGGNRHGFLPFSEIHPDYYQIPKADKEALLKQIQEIAEAKVSKESAQQNLDAPEAVEKNDENIELSDGEEDGISQAMIAEEQGFARPEFYKKYKIQEVIKKDQVILVQITKEERGNKGASLTTYLSLAGRYCVLMPNSTRAGGVSRKIVDQEDRNRLRELVEEFHEKSEGQASVVIRTAGAYKTKAEIRKDFDYLSRLWNNIRQHTLASQAPAFIHEEGDVIKRTIRDTYDSDVDEIVIAGEEAYKSAFEFIKKILPRHTNKLKKHNDAIPIFSKYGIEAEVSGLYSNIVQLDSGGYLVITATEALIAIDVNSGRAIRERNAENTALTTNIEAAKEAAYQIMLRDLSGIIVIDFIDMNEGRNRRAVEDSFRNHMVHDRARLQVGKINNLGLLTLSRQRLKYSFLEYNMQECSHCHGRGSVRVVGATALVILRAIQDELARSKGSIKKLSVSASENLIFHLLNRKRKELYLLEEQHKCEIELSVDNEAGADGFFIEVADVEVSKEKSALSAIDIEPYQKIAVDSEVGEVKQEEKKHRYKEKRKKTENVFEEKKDDEIEALSPETKTIKNKKPQRKRFKKGRTKEDGAPIPIQDAPEFDQIESDNFEQDMQNKQQQNQSLLREIWKKIVE
jgi:ribonuclease E